MAHSTTGELTAVATVQPDQRLRRLNFQVTGTGVFVLWNAMALVGALLSSLLDDPKAWGLDGATLAVFCELLQPRLVARDAVATAITAAAVAVILVPAFPTELPILATVMVGGGVILSQRRRITRRDQSSRDEGAR